jgi:hypothetical protein
VSRLQRTSVTLASRIAALKRTGTTPLTRPNKWLSPTVSFIQRVWDHNEPTVQGAIGMTVTILTMWEMHGLLKWTLGVDSKMFGCIPVIYLSHFGDLFAFLRFYWSEIRKF